MHNYSNLFKHDIKAFFPLLQKYTGNAIDYFIIIPYHCVLYMSIGVFKPRKFNFGIKIKFKRSYRIQWSFWNKDKCLWNCVSKEYAALWQIYLGRIKQFNFWEHRIALNLLISKIYSFLSLSYFKCNHYLELRADLAA